MATAAIKALEASLGARLLQRTTRHVQPTAEGSLYYQRCVSILAALEEANRSAGGSISGTIRVDVGNARTCCRACAAAVSPAIRPLRYR